MFSNTNYNLYKTFVAVYEFQSISRAAKELFTGQPNVSRSIKELERQLGVKLFHSGPRGVEATSVGRELYLKVSPALAWIDYGEKSIREFNETSTGVIRISIATNSAGQYLLPYITGFSKKYPNIQFEIQNRASDSGLEMLGRNRVDLVLSTLPIHDKGEFEQVVLAKLNEVGIVNKDKASEWGIGATITEEKFRELPYIYSELQTLRKKPNLIANTQEISVKLVKEGLGVAFCGEQFIDQNYNGEFVKFKIKGDNARVWNLVCLYNRRYLSKAVDEFLKLIKSSIELH
jgi:DNA-binding transcriptional LysR family regulator